MKTSLIGSGMAALALLGAAHLSMQAIAAEGFGAAKQTDVSVAVMADGREQYDRAVGAYNRGDYAEAFRLFRNVSVLGEPEAHYRLGLMYAEGLGTRKSLHLAAYWLRLAARQNHPGAAKALTALKSSEASS
jgi:TPR repeat protein